MILGHIAFSHLNLDFFILGSVAYQWYAYLKTKEVKHYIGQILLALCLLSIVFVSEISIPNQVVKQLLFYGLIFISIPYVFLSFKNNSVDRYIGELSFSIYISHLLIVSLLHPVFFNHTYPMMYYGVATLFFSIVLAVVFNHLIVQPIEKWRYRKINIPIES